MGSSEDLVWPIMNLKAALNALYDAARRVDYQDLCAAQERTASWRQAMNGLRLAMRCAEEQRTVTYASLHKTLEEYRQGDQCQD
jgi:hypothetical protein